MLLAKNFVLAGLAHTADAVLVTAGLITEGGRGGTVTGHAETLADDVRTVLAAVKGGEECVEQGVLLSGFHVVHYTKGLGVCQGVTPRFLGILKLLPA